VTEFTYYGHCLSGIDGQVYVVQDLNAGRITEVDCFESDLLCRGQINCLGVISYLGFYVK